MPKDRFGRGGMTQRTSGFDPLHLQSSFWNSPCDAGQKRCGDVIEYRHQMRSRDPFEPKNFGNSCRFITWQRDFVHPRSREKWPGMAVARFFKHFCYVGPLSRAEKTWSRQHSRRSSPIVHEGRVEHCEEALGILEVVIALTHILAGVPILRPDSSDRALRRQRQRTLQSATWSVQSRSRVGTRWCWAAAINTCSNIASRLPEMA